MSLWAKTEKTPVATLEVRFFGDREATVDTWVNEAGGEQAGYHAILHYLMYYARLLFFLSYRETGDELVGWTDDAVRALAAAQGGEPVAITRDWRLVAEAPGASRAVWSSSLALVGPGKYRCLEQRPEDPEDADAQATALLHLQRLADTLPAVERAYLTLAIAGMHEYYREIQHWGTSMSLHPAPRYGMSHARRVLGGQ
jgi:hypothetical protein